MARGVNKVILIGHLGADPEVRYMPNSDAVTNITIATSESWIDKQSQEKRESTEWHRVVLYRRLAEIAGEYLRKGSKVYVEGRLRTRKWQDQQNIDRYTTEIIVEDLQMLDGRPDNGGGYNQGDDQQGGYQQGGQQGGPQNRQRAPQSGKTNQPQGGQQNRQRPQQGGQQNNNQPQGGFNQPQGGDPQGGGGYAQNQGPGRGPMEPPIDFDDDIPF